MDEILTGIQGLTRGVIGPKGGSAPSGEAWRSIKLIAGSQPQQDIQGLNSRTEDYSAVIHGSEYSAGKS